jgi:hypothetical protein
MDAAAPNAQASRTDLASLWFENILVSLDFDFFI